MNNPAIKRLARELQEIQQFRRSENCPDEDWCEAAPLKDDLFEWHFTVRGPQSSVYSEGFYHGRILFPSDYPFSPPSISFLTPNGRWEVEKKICLSVTGFHPEMWQPAWGIRTILLALKDHFTTDDKAAIGYLDYSPESRKELALKSKSWKCKLCPYEAAGTCDDGRLDPNCETACTAANCHSTMYLFWIGAVLLVLSILASYTFLYLS